jgi:hypothetical protein
MWKFFLSYGAGVADYHRTESDSRYKNDQQQIQGEEREGRKNLIQTEGQVRERWEANLYQTMPGPLYPITRTIPGRESDRAKTVAAKTKRVTFQESSFASSDTNERKKWWFEYYLESKRSITENNERRIRRCFAESSELDVRQIVHNDELQQRKVLECQHQEALMGLITPGDLSFTSAAMTEEVRTPTTPYDLSKVF